MNKVYRVSTSKLSWAESSDSCKKWNGKLVEVNNDNEQKLLEDLLVNTEKFWIGIDKSQPTKMV